MALIASASVWAQPEKDLKNASKALNKYFLDPGNNADVLQESLDLLNSAFKSDDIKKVSGSWITRGKIYNEVANSDFQQKTIIADYEIKQPEAPRLAYEAFKEAYKLSEKKSEKKDALEGMQEAESHLNNFAIFAYQAQEYDKAYSNFKSSLDAYDAIKEMGATSRLDEVENGYNDQLFFAAVSGYYGGMKAESKPLFLKLYEMDSSEAVVYDALYNIAKEEGQDDAIKYLEAGREKFPDDTSLLFTEINHYLTAGQLEKLIDKLKIAIEKEPDNVSVYTTLGSVYDQLQVQALADVDNEKATEYFDAAFDYYNQAMAKDDKNFEAIYSMGALYYNKAATYVEKLNEYAADFSKEGMKKYDDTKIEMDDLFKQALPYFEQAESVNSEDLNTIIALKEIHARLNDLEKSNTYKEKYDALQGGE